MCSSQSKLQADKQTLGASAVLQNLAARDLCNPDLKKMWIEVDFSKTTSQTKGAWNDAGRLEVAKCDFRYLVPAVSESSSTSRPVGISARTPTKLSFFVGFLSSSSPMPTYCLQLHHDRSSPHFSQFIIHQSWNLTLFWLRNRQRLSITNK